MLWQSTLTRLLMVRTLRSEMESAAIVALQPYRTSHSVPYGDGHLATAHLTFHHRSLPEAPNGFYICQTTILLCCHQLLPDEVQASINEFIGQDFACGTWVHGEQ